MFNTCKWSVSTTMAAKSSWEPSTFIALPGSQTIDHRAAATLREIPVHDDDSGANGKLLPYRK